MPNLTPISNSLSFDSYIENFQNFSFGAIFIKLNHISLNLPK